jgi:NADH dehydrogenase
MIPTRYAVTGAFGFTGKYITRRLLSTGGRVLTLTGHPQRPHPFGNQVEIAPFNFADPEALTRTLEGVEVLFNTYWVRFNYRSTTYDQAVTNTRILIRAARQAGVQRIVHVSITNANAQSPLPYFRGKGLLEEAIRSSGLSYAILRPALIFGEEGILINNIAWLLRRFPFFVIPGDGSYRLQPIFVEDLADLAVSAALTSEDQTIDAIGPETFTFRQLVLQMAEILHRRPRIIHLPPTIAWTLTQCIGWLVGDVVLTKDEVQGLLADLLYTDSPPVGRTSLTTWLRQHAATIGKRYASELERHYR